MRKSIIIVLMLLGLTFLGTSVVLADLNNGLVAYYPFNGNANDESGNENHGTVKWSISTIDSTGNVGDYTSIAVDSNDKVHISYRDTSNQDLKYATNSSGSWIQSTIDSSGTTGWDTSIAIGLSNIVHISYKSESGGDLKCNKHIGCGIPDHR